MTRRVCLVIMVALVLVACASPAAAQRRGGSRSFATASTRFEITPIYGYQWGGTIRTYEGDVVFEGSDSWGVIADVTVRSGAQLELLYWRQDTELVLKGGGLGVPTQLFDATVEYWHGGGLVEYRRQGNVRLFGTMTIGATHVDPKPSVLSDDWRFSAIFGVGAKVLFSERVGIRLQASMPLTFIASSGAVFCGGGACYTTIGGEGLPQGNLSAGLIVAF